MKMALRKFACKVRHTSGDEAFRCAQHDVTYKDADHRRVALKWPSAAYNWAKLFGGDEELRSAAARVPKWSYYYAMDIDKCFNPVTYAGVCIARPEDASTYARGASYSEYDEDFRTRYISNVYRAEHVTATLCVMVIKDGNILSQASLDIRLASEEMAKRAVKFITGSTHLEHIGNLHSRSGVITNGVVRLAADWTHDA